MEQRPLPVHAALASPLGGCACKGREERAPLSVPRRSVSATCVFRPCCQRLPEAGGRVSPLLICVESADEQLSEPTGVAIKPCGDLGALFEYAEYDFASPVTGDLILYASYVKNAEPSVPEQDQPAAPAPSDEVSPEQAKADAAAEAEANVPETGDATNATAVAGIGIAGLVAAAASFFLRRRNEQ